MNLYAIYALLHSQDDSVVRPARRFVFSTARASAYLRRGYLWYKRVCRHVGLKKSNTFCSKPKSAWI